MDERAYVERAFEELSERDLATLDPADRLIIERALPHTMTGVLRLQALITAVRYLVARRVPGALVECGVWQGGSVVAMIATLQSLEVTNRDIYLFDTFEGMTAPTERDTSPVERPASEIWEESQGRPWPELFDAAVFSEERVRERVIDTGYPSKRLHFVRGSVERTLPDRAPDRLALLRLDTDWYESTRHELEHLYPRLADGGVLIVDDYGHWEGCRRAVDEYMASRAEQVLFARIDYSGRIAIKH